MGSLALDAMIESRRQIGYLVVTLAVAVAAWFALAAMVAPFTGSGGKGSGAIISNGSQSNATLPLKYAARIVHTPGAHDVTWTALQLVKCGSGSRFVTLNAYGGPGARHALAVQQHINPRAVRRWSTDPLGVVISDRTARDCGWRVGQGVAPSTAMGGKLLQLHISGIFQSQHPHGDVAFAHFDYINRTGSMFGKDRVIVYTAHASSPSDDELLAARIEQEFAHDFPTVSVTTNTTVHNAWARFGKVQQLLALVMIAIFLCVSSVLVSVLAHSAAQRRRQFALLQVFGFGRAMLFAAFALEAVLVLVVGAALGTGVGIWIEHLVAPTNISLWIGGFLIPDWAYRWLPAWLAVLLVASLGWPASMIRQVRPVDLRAP